MLETLGQVSAIATTPGLISSAGRPADARLMTVMTSTGSPAMVSCCTALNTARLTPSSNIPGTSLMMYSRARAGSMSAAPRNARCVCCCRLIVARSIQKPHKKSSMSVSGPISRGRSSVLAGR